MASYIERRKFLATLGGVAAWPLAARAQQPAVVNLISAASVAVWATVAQAQTATERYNLQERCGKFAAEVFAKEWGTGFSNTDNGQAFAAYRNHYNFRLNKCFYLELSTVEPRSGDERPFNSSRLFDLHEITEIGTYQQLGDEVVSCDVQGKECHSLLEYQALIKPFMGD
jgi:hypothetical protein